MRLIALVRAPSPDRAGACEQHAAYVDALRHAGAQVVQVPAAPTLPEAVFIEDCAFVLDALAVIARPAHAQGEELPGVTRALSHYRFLVQPPPAARFEGGDVLGVGRTVYLGQSNRTNALAISYLSTLLRQFNYDVVRVPINGGLHLKSAVTDLGSNTVLLNPDCVPRELFDRHSQIEVDPQEPMGANALCVNHQLLLSASCPRTAYRLAAHGYKPRLLEIGEFQRAGGGLTGLSILFTEPGPA